MVPGPTSYPGLGGLGRVQVSALSFGSLLHPGAYLGLHPTLGKKSNQISVKTFFLLFNKFWAKNRKKNMLKFGAGSLIYGLGGPIRFGGPVSTFVPLEKFLSEALLVARLCASALMLVSHKPASSTFFLSVFVPSSHPTF